MVVYMDIKELQYEINRLMNDEEYQKEVEQKKIKLIDDYNKWLIEQKNLIK